MNENNYNERNIIEGQYGEGIFYLDGYDTTSDEEQSAIDTLLYLNQGVGIIAGYFDANFSIHMISKLAIRLFQYADYTEFLDDTNASLINMVGAGEEWRYLRNKLINPNAGLWTFPFKCKNGRSLSVRICNVVRTMPDGKKMWYISVRRFSENLRDSLTGGYNRDGFVRIVERMMKYGVNIKEYAVLYINIRGFKAVNELYGSESGDDLLITIYKTLLTCKLKPEICARRDSDHFLLIVKNDLLDLDELSNLLNIRWKHVDHTLFLHAVCGIYYIDDSTSEVLAMIDRARMAMDEIQDEYVTPYIVYDQNLRSTSIDRMDVISHFKEGIDNREFVVYYQPVIDVKTEKVASAEALVRWKTKNRGMISPGVFIPELEQSGYIVQLDRYVVHTVKDFIFNRQKSELEIVPISVNLSQMDFFDGEKIDELIGILNDDCSLCKHLHFEITESAHATIKECQQKFIETVHKHSGKVYLDDFGSGTASLKMIGDYNFNVLKIDMHFVNSMMKNPKVYLLVKMMIYMSHKLDMKVVAEGVETSEQLSLLREADCDYVQGFYFSKPLEEQDFIKYLNDHT